MQQADHHGTGHDQAEGADGKSDEHGKPILLHHGEPDDADGECRQPIAEGDGESENHGQHQERHADQALAGPGKERGEPRPQQLFGPLEMGKRATHDRLEILPRHRLAREPMRKPRLVAAVGELGREQHERRAEHRREQRYVDRDQIGQGKDEQEHAETAIAERIAQAAEARLGRIEARHIFAQQHRGTPVVHIWLRRSALSAGRGWLAGHLLQGGTRPVHARRVPATCRSSHISQDYDD